MKTSRRGFAPPAVKTYRLAGKKWRGFRGGNFLPARRKLLFYEVKQKTGNYPVICFIFILLIF